MISILCVKMQNDLKIGHVFGPNWLMSVECPPGAVPIARGQHDDLGALSGNSITF